MAVFLLIQTKGKGMKKITLLTSVLALAACGGGSGSGGGVASAPVTPYTFDISGVEFVSPETEGATTTIFTTDKKGNIITADFGFGNPIKNETISTDKLQVSAYEVRFVNPNDPEDDFHYTLTENPTSTEHLHQLLITEIQREEDGNEEDMINYVKTLDMEDFDIEYATYNFDLQFFGKEIGMKYAELATMTMHGVENGVEFTEPQVLVGGDETKLVETIDPTQKYEFGGKAIAMVDYEFETYDNNAKLVLDPENNTETLTMNLADWYNVEIVNNDGNVVFDFDDTDKVIDDKYTFDVYGGAEQHFETKYYGENANPTEATATFGTALYKDNGMYYDHMIFTGGFAGTVK